MSARRKLGTVVLWVVAIAVVGAGAAGVWFGIHMIVTFEPRDVAYGSMFNPRIPDRQQRLDNVVYSGMVIGLGAGLIASVLIAVWKARRR